MKKKCIYNGKIILPTGVLFEKALLFDERILDIIDASCVDGLSCDEYDCIDAKGAYISAGFIDLHIHGYNGCDTMDASIDSLQTIAKGVSQGGVTSFLPTTMSMPLEAIRLSLEAIRTVQKQQNVKIFTGSEILGAHMEGPYLNPRFKGAQNAIFLLQPSEETFTFIKKYEDVLRIITLAPELPNALELIEKIKKETSIHLSMGHTEATYGEAVLGIEKGISHVTHLFNAMTGLHHRNPGVVGAALSKEVSCELIADTLHVDPGLFPLLVKVKKDKLVLVTDCMSAGGMPYGEYTLGAQKVIVNQTGARLMDGTLAGSVLSLSTALKNIIDYTELPLNEATNLLTLNPAKVIHMENTKGSLEIGKDADITLFDENINILCTIGKGHILYEKV